MFNETLFSHTYMSIAAFAATCFAVNEVQTSSWRLLDSYKTNLMGLLADFQITIILLITT